MLSFPDFLNEYYKPAPKSHPDMVRLYRGDSTYVAEYDPDKFELGSLFGPGTYLTDHRHVAKSYTTKGDKGKVIADFIVDDSQGAKKKLAITYFAVYHLMYSLAGQPQPADDSPVERELYDFYHFKLSRFQDWERYEDWRDYDREDAEWSPEERTQSKREAEVYYAKRRQEDDALEAKFGALFAAAEQHLRQFKHRYQFVLVSHHGDEAHWEVIDKTNKQGHISEFDVPGALVEHCYDADAPVSAEVLKIVVACWALDIKEQTTSGKKIYDHYRTFKIYTKNDGDRIDTLSKLVGNCTPLRDWGKRVWAIFTKRMKALGYTGIHYGGGRITGNPVAHNAYVLWDFNQLVRIR